MKTLVTGASRGIGLAICKELARQGHDLIMIAKTPATLQKIASQIAKKFKVKTYAYAIDLANQGEIPTAIKAMEPALKGLNNLVLNAGIYIEGSLRTGNIKDLETQMQVNVYSSIQLVQGLLPFLNKKSPRRIVITSSTNGYKASNIVPFYSITKWATHGLATNLRNELSQQKISVTCLAPGSTWTDMWKEPGVDETRFIDPADIAKITATVLSLSGRVNVDEIRLRPILETSY